MRHLYHPTALDPQNPAKSWWADSLVERPAIYPELIGDQQTDVAVIGGGYTGLSAALHLTREHQIGVQVLERAFPGWGASGRNGGFCCMGSSKLSWGEVIAKFGRDDARAFYRAQVESIDLVGDLLKREGIDADRSGSGEIALAHKPGVTKDFAAEVDFMAREFGARWTILNRAELEARGMKSGGFHGAIHNPVGFGLNPMKYVTGLAAAASRAGAKISAQSPVNEWRREGNKQRLVTPKGSLLANRVLIATNGYTPEDLHPDFGGRLLPALSSVVATRPMTKAELAAQGWTSTDMAYDLRNLLHYFRLLPDGRMVFGGRGGLSAEPGALARQSQRIEAAFRAYFPAWAGVEITHRWSGLVCLAMDVIPHVGKWEQEPGTYFALAYHGNGVGMASWAGRASANVIAGGIDERPNLMRRLPPRFPFPPLRPLYLRGAYIGYGIKDRLT
jgi:glycine/D-amino acid oxidase-like deaminating enzyme